MKSSDSFHSGGAGGHVQHAGCGKHALGECNDRAGAQDRGDKGSGGADGGRMRGEALVAATLWACATMGREPGAGMRGRRGLCEEWARSG